MQTQLIHQKLATINKSVGAITKSKIGAGFKYRGIDDVYNTLHQSFADNEVFITTKSCELISEHEKTSKSGGCLMYKTYRFTYVFYASDGSFVESTSVGEAMDSGDKGTNKCMSNALKYALMQMFLIPTEELEELEIESHKQSPPLLTEIQVKINECETNEMLTKLYNSLSEVEQTTNKEFFGKRKNQLKTK